VYIPQSLYLLCFHKCASNLTNCLFVQADYMRDDAVDYTSARHLDVYLLWLFGYVMFCRSQGEAVSRFPIPMLRRSPTPRGSSPRGQLGCHYFGGDIWGFVRWHGERHIQQGDFSQLSATTAPLVVRAPSRGSALH
jgi:hypothetical protein